MGRCEGYYRLENRRCDRPGNHEIAAADGQLYAVCDYHARQTWSTVARWHGESGLRSALPTPLRSEGRASAAA